MTATKTEVLTEWERLGAISAKGVSAQARAFECPEDEAADWFQNACENAAFARDAAGVSEDEAADAWDRGWASVRKTK